MKKKKNTPKKVDGKTQRFPKSKEWGYPKGYRIEDPKGYRSEWHTPKSPYDWDHEPYGHRHEWEEVKKYRHHEHPHEHPHEHHNVWREAIATLAAIQILVITALVFF